MLLLQSPAGRLPKRGRCSGIVTRIVQHVRVRQGARLLLVVGAYLALAAGLFNAAWRSPAQLAVGGGADVPYTIWFMRWVPFALAHGWNPLLTDYLDYPSGVNLMWNGLFPLPAILLAPVTMAFGPVVARNLLMTLAVGGSAFSAFVAISRYVAHRGGAFLGGLLYGFSPFMLAQSLGHLQLTVAFIPPLLLLALDDVVHTQRRSVLWAGLWFGALGALQLWSGEEMLATEALVAVIGVALLAALHPTAVRAHAPYAARAGAVAAATALTLAAFPLAVQFFGPQRVGGTLQPLNIYASDLVNFVLPTRIQAFAPAAALQVTDQLTGNLTEWNAYLGIPLIALIAVMVTRAWHSAVLRLSAVLGLTVAILSMGITLHVGGTMTALPIPMLALAFPRVRHGVPGKTMLFTITAAWAALALLPTVRNILPNRLMLYVFLFAGILLAMFVAWAARAVSARRRLLGGLLVALALVPLAPRLPFPSQAVTSPPFFTAEAAHVLPAGAVALVAPYARGGYADAMLWQADSGMAFRMPEGYAFVPGPSLSPPPSALGDRMIEIERQGGSGVDPVRRQAMLGNLATWQVRTVVVGPMAHQADMIAFFTDLLGRAPVERGGVYLFEGITPEGTLATRTYNVQLPVPE